jgi:hypothetical protein
MKGTVLFSLLFLFVGASYGQKSPCDLKKSTWQTALSVEDGTVQYLVETSNCVGSEVCGQPRIILKHTFKKPLWFKVKLRGFDCSNTPLETDFATGNKHITPDEEFSVQQNWHSFKYVSEVVNVEVSYEQPVVKHITFDKEDKTIKTYANGVLVDKSSTAAASTPSVETAKMDEKPAVAVVSTPVAKTTKTAEKPVVAKTTKAVEKPVAAKTTKTAEKPVVAKTTKKVEEKPVVATASTPSVEKVETVEKPVVAAASTPSVEKVETIEKPVVAAASTPSVEKVETVEKPIVAAASTPLVEKVETIEKPVVATASTPSVEKVETVEKPVVATKTPPVVEKTKAVAPKIEATATTPETNTQTITPVRRRLNVLKTNILSPIGLTFERGLGRRLSLGVTGLYLPRLSYGTPEGITGYTSLAKPSMGFLGEARIYTSKTKAPLNGFYIGGYYQFRTLDMLSRKISKTATSETDIQITLPSSFTNFGLMIGGQRIRSRGFTTDLSFGVGYYSFSNIPVISNESNSYLKNLSNLSKRQSGFAPRLGLSLGYAF